MGYSIIEADLLRHRQEIEALWSAAGEAGFARRFEWLYLGNPAGPARVWLARHLESGDFVGATALFPRTFLVRGESAVAGIAGDLFVLPKHRSFGPALMLLRSALSASDSGVFDFIYAFPNDAAEPLFRRLHYERLAGMTSLVRILATGPYVERIPFMKGRGSRLGAVLDSVRNVVSRDMWKRLPPGLVCREVDDWSEFSPGFFAEYLKEHVVCSERSAGFLAWRYRCPGSENRILALFRAGQEAPLAFLVYRVGPALVEIRDIGFGELEETFSALMTAFLRRTRQLRAERIVISGVFPARTLRRFRAAGFHARPRAGSIYLSLPPRRQDLAALLKDPEHWLLLQSDDDM